MLSKRLKVLLQLQIRSAPQQIIAAYFDIWIFSRQFLGFHAFNLGLMKKYFWNYFNIKANSVLSNRSFFTSPCLFHLNFWLADVQGVNEARNIMDGSLPITEFYISENVNFPTFFSRQELWTTTRELRNSHWHVIGYIDWRDWWWGGGVNYFSLW